MNKNYVSPLDICQLELPVQNMERAIIFYLHVFGWKPLPTQIKNVTIIEVPDECPFGISLVLRPKRSQQCGPLIYYKHDSPKILLSCVEKHGGNKIAGPTEIKGYGYVYQIEDSEGNNFGIFKTN